MKYYIVGKTSEKGPTYDDSGDLNSYYEFGWELMVTHILVKKFLFEKKINNDDVIVTANDDRKCLYTKSFLNVISWNEFLNINNSEFQIVDLVDMSVNGSLSEFGKLPTIHDTNYELSDLISSFESCNSIISSTKNQTFVCLHYRKREWSSNRNINDVFFADLVNFFSKEIKVKVYVIGFGGEKFCNNLESFYVNLKEFCTLISLNNCKLFFSTMSGPAHLSYLFGKKNLLHIVNSIEGPRQESLKNHPLYMGDYYNFKNVNLHIIPYNLSVSEFKNELKNFNIFDI